MLLIVLIGACGQTSDPSPELPPGATGEAICAELNAEIAPGGPGRQPESAWIPLEVCIIENLDDPIVGAVRYEQETKQVVVTVFSDELSGSEPDAQLAQLQEQAQHLVRDIPVIVVVEPGERPTAD